MRRDCFIRKDYIALNKVTTFYSNFDMSRSGLIGIDTLLKVITVSIPRQAGEQMDTIVKVAACRICVGRVSGLEKLGLSMTGAKSFKYGNSGKREFSA